MEMIKKLWRLQEKQQRDLGLAPGDMADAERSDLAMKLIIGLYEECGELSRIISMFKGPLIDKAKFSKGNTLEEIVDVAKYLIAIAQLYEYSAVEFCDVFIEKTRTVKHRAESSSVKLESGTNVVAVDLDGCIVDDSELLGELSNTCLMGIDRIEHEESLKNIWRRNGRFRTLPVVSGAAAALQQLKRDGFKIVVITSRPYKQYKSLYADTVDWLKNQNIVYDLLLFDRDKAEAISTHVFPANVVLFVEDKEKHALEISALGLNVALLNIFGRLKNVQFKHDLIKIVSTWYGIPEMARRIRCRTST